MKNFPVVQLTWVAQTSAALNLCAHSSQLGLSLRRAVGWDRQYSVRKGSSNLNLPFQVQRVQTAFPKCFRPVLSRARQDPKPAHDVSIPPVFVATSSVLRASCLPLLEACQHRPPKRRVSIKLFIHLIKKEIMYTIYSLPSPSSHRGWGGGDTKESRALQVGL